MKKIITIGNALTDIVISDADKLISDLKLQPASMQLIDEATFNALSSRCGGEPRKIIAGGSAANTAAGIGMLGGKVGFIGKIGSDTIGQNFAAHLQNNNIYSHLIENPDVHSGCCHVLVGESSERTMVTYLGAAATLTADDIDINVLRNYDLLHIEGYLVQDYTLIKSAIAKAHEAGLEISLDLASYNIVEENLDFLQSIVHDYVDIIFANETEAHAFTKESPEKALAICAEQCKIAIVKTGAEGSYVKSGIDTFFTPSQKVNAIDTTGAGDIYASGFLYAYTQGRTLEECARIATLCAANVVQYQGAQMPLSTWNSIKYALK